MDNETLVIPDGERAAVAEEAERTLANIGSAIRKLRRARSLTIQQVADAAGISTSMLSLVERGLTAPSLLSLTAISRTLGTTLAELISPEAPLEEEAVTRFHDLPVLETPDGVVRRVLRQDRQRGVTLTYNDYAPGVGNSPVGITHTGFEFGLVLEGELTIEIDGVPKVLHSGDVVSLKSTRLHKIWNYSSKRATTVWFNLEDRS